MGCADPVTRRARLVYGAWLVLLAGFDEEGNDRDLGLRGGAILRGGYGLRVATRCNLLLRRGAQSGGWAASNKDAVVQMSLFLED